MQSLILGALAQLGTAGPQEILSRCQTRDASISGVAVRKSLRRLLKSGVIRKPGYGQYCLSADYWERLEPPGDWMRREIQYFLHEKGGIAKRAEINHRFGAQPHGDERDGKYRSITTVLAESGSFRQDFGYGIWNLPREDLEALPLTGHWATHRLLDGGGHETAFAKAQAYFNRVGAAFSRARKNFIEDLVEDRELRRLLEELGLESPTVLSRLRTGKIVVGETREIPYAALYAAFEAGNFTLHRKAPAAFYRRCAEIFGREPGPLSRGGLDFAEVLPELIPLDPTEVKSGVKDGTVRTG